MLCCASIVFLSRSEPGVICMKDDDFGGTKTKEFCDWRKIITTELFLTNQWFAQFFWCTKKILYFRFSFFFSLAETTPYSARPGRVRLRFSF
jgi:hypothetical protein